MKRKLFFAVGLVLSCLYGFLVLRFYYFDFMLSQTEFFSVPSAGERLLSTVEAFLPLVLLAGIIIAACAWGRRHLEVWERRERIRTALTYLLGIVCSVFLFAVIYLL